MKTRRLRFPYTFAATGVATIVLVAAAFLKIDLLPGIDIMGIEPSEAGEVSIGFLLLLPAVLIDRLVSRQRVHDAQLQAERLRVVQVTMRTVQDIVNNALNQLQLVRLEAEPHVSQDVLTVFDKTIQGTAAKLTELGDLETYVETQMGAGPGLASSAPSA
jgi:hypothetical protein